MSKPVAQSIAIEEFYSREGYRVRFDDLRWKLSKDIDIPISALAANLSAEMYLSFRHVLAFFAKTGSPAHAVNIFYSAKYYLESTTGHPPFSVESLISFRSTLNDKTEYRLGTLRGFITQWAALGYAGIHSEIPRLLDKWTLKGNEKGYAVQSMCPDRGPLTDIEIEGVVAAILSAYSENRLALVDVCYSMTLVMTGRRPVQVTGLKLKDLIRQADSYFINFPRAKQRNQSWRSTFNKFAVVEDLWLLLQQQALAVRQLFANRLATKIPEELVPELPLFPALKALNDESELKDQLRRDRLHASSASVTKAMGRVAKVISVISERTGLPVHLNPTRFRYTLGTNLAREGNGEFVIAEALDHSDIQNAGVYVRNIPEIVERIDKAVALQLAPIAQAFQGVLVVSERDARRGSDPDSRISNGVVNLGTCGSYGFCGALAPIACYTCNHFQPWLDGPHEAVLDGLIYERDRLLKKTEDRKIASVNDRMILAVSDVVNRCSGIRGEGARG
ncbi:site-specific integrase [Pseudomonas fragi]|uniref:site-specific integrase n=1 Tax=Pseudomonas fragi TaxID=296 RepID=UPI00193BE428|nr:site-specific integrase [Pseudomonas fragi]MBM1205903.1 phage integrase family protein [Pseudomonas fragi]